MSVCKGVLSFLMLFFVTDLVRCSEYVPVYMWSTRRANEKVPALNKISQHTFEYDILERLKEKTYTVVFTEPTLSPEDFAQHDQSSGIFPHLTKLAKSSKVTYLPYVQNPIRALKHLDHLTITEVPLERLGENFEIPQTDILIVNLNDVKDSETRIEMLKRHDAAISSIFREIAKTNENVLALYTAHHTSWVASEEVSSKQKRSLLAVAEEIPMNLRESLKPDNNSKFLHDSNVFLYLTNSSYIVGEKENNVTFTYESTVIVNNSTNKIQLAFQSTDLSLTLNFTNATMGYWQLEEPIFAVLTNNTEKIEYNLTSGSPLYAVSSFSYHCGDQMFLNENFSLTLKDFQIQVFFEKLFDNATLKFNDAYDCVGFTSIPIWTGLFVTTILLIIMTIGITMMMDIRTMDRYDDPKGKTITVYAE